MRAMAGTVNNNIHSIFLRCRWNRLTGPISTANTVMVHEAVNRNAANVGVHQPEKVVGPDLGRHALSLRTRIEIARPT